MITHVYKIDLEYYPKIHWALKRQVTRKLTENDKAAGFSSMTWETVTADLHTRIRDKAKRAAWKILDQRHPDKDCTLLIGKED